MLGKEVSFDTFTRLFSVLGIKTFTKASLPGAFKIILFLLAAPVYSIYLIVMVANLRDFEEKLQVIQIIPFYFVITIKVVDFSINYNKIVKFIESVKKVSVENGDKKFVKSSHVQAVSILRFCFIFNFLTPLIVQTVSLFTQTSMLPIWIPQQFKELGSLGFYVHWFITTFCGLYASCFVMSIDLLMVYLMMRIKGFSQFLVEKTVRFESNTARTAEMRNLTFVKNACKLRRWKSLNFPTCSIIRLFDFSLTDDFSEAFYVSIFVHAFLAIVSQGFLAYSIIELVRFLQFSITINGTIDQKIINVCNNMLAYKLSAFPCYRKLCSRPSSWFCWRSEFWWRHWTGYLAISAMRSRPTAKCWLKLCTK